MSTRNKQSKLRKFAKKFANKMSLLALIVFILSLFLLDVNANLIGAYGPKILVNFIKGIKLPATSMFWLGFLGAAVSFLIFSTRSMYLPKMYNKKIDFIFALVGIAGLMIILSGGMLLFWHDNSLQIPFFSYTFTRIDYYHAGIGLEVLSILYYAITK